MARKLLAVLLTLTVIACGLPFTAMADVEPPTTLGAPEHFGASKHGEYQSTVKLTFSAPEDMRDYIKRRAADDPNNKQSFSPHFQIDYKIDNGSWHHTPDWDFPKTMSNRKNNNYFTLLTVRNI